MKREVWVKVVFVAVVALLLLTSLNAGQPAAAEPPAPGASSQDVVAPSRGGPGTSSQGTEAQTLPASGEPQDLPPFVPGVVAAFYHVPGSTLMPVAASTTLAYANTGCIYAASGGDDLLNAPLDIPDGSTLVGIRLYYYDANAGTDVSGWITRYDESGTAYNDIVHAGSSGDAGYGNVWGDANPAMSTVDMYTWSYVLNARLNDAASSLQVCGIRVMYYPPIGKVNLLPSTLYNAHP